MDNKAWMEDIAKRLDAIAHGELFSVDGDFRTWDELTEEEQEEYENTKDEGEDARIHAVSMWEYFSDNYGVWYLVDEHKDLLHGRICIAFGGPNVYVDTDSGRVELYWWLDRAEAYLSAEARNAVDGYLQELYDCC